MQLPEFVEEQVNVPRLAFTVKKWVVEVTTYVLM